MLFLSVGLIYLPFSSMMHGYVLISEYMVCQMYFQVMMDERIIKDDDSDTGGEIEIERVPTRTVEARSKELIPVFDYLQSPMFQQPRYHSYLKVHNIPLSFAHIDL